MYAYWQLDQIGRWSFRTSTDAPPSSKITKIKNLKEVAPEHLELPFKELKAIYTEE